MTPAFFNFLMKIVLLISMLIDIFFFGIYTELKFIIVTIVLFFIVVLDYIYNSYQDEIIDKIERRKKIKW